MLWRYVNYPESHIAVKNLGHPFLFEELHPLSITELERRDEAKAREEAMLDERQVEVYLLREETLDDLAAATGLAREWFVDALAFDEDFGLQSKVYVIPQEVR
jgi:hypothetical protein